MKKLITNTLLFTIIATVGFAQKKKVLFDGSNLNAWHTYHRQDTQGWEIKDNLLTSNGKGGDLVTNDDFENFDLSFEFKIAPKGNSGLIYKVIEDPKKPTYYSGVEYQIIDDAGYPLVKVDDKMVPIKDTQKTGANYDMEPPHDLTAVKPAGEWNVGRIRIKNNKITHWINGKIVVEYIYGGDVWKEQLAKSKFANLPYATPHAKGKIALQGHGDSVWFRNIKIKEL